MSDTKKIRYNGDNGHEVEVPATGRKWQTGETDYVRSDIAAELIAQGLFDEVGEPIEFEEESPEN